MGEAGEISLGKPGQRVCGWSWKKEMRKERRNRMPTCKECKNYFPLEDDESMGDCVQRVVDPRQAYYRAKPVAADQDASKCSQFAKR
jgi:benzylsuccinate synthase